MSHCATCGLSEERCVCNYPPPLQALYRKLYKIEDFIHYYELCKDKNVTKLSLELTHKKFRNNKTNLYLNIEGHEMYCIIQKAVEEAEQQKYKLLERIRSYEG